MTVEDANLISDVTENEVAIALEKMNQSSAPGPDGVPPHIYKEVFSTSLLLTFLAQIFNSCLNFSFTPSQWRKAEVFVLHKKKGSTSDVNSFRGIALTHYLGKVITELLV